MRMPPMRMPPMPTALCLLACLSLSLPACAADAWPHDGECSPWGKVAPPKQDMGTAPAGCDAQALYYGTDGKGAGRNYVAARHCAYRQPRDGDALLQEGDLFGGSGILMMLYANGQGVKRNIPLAKRFACEYGGAPAEVSGRLAHLDAIAAGTDKAPMDICDDITSGMMMGFCSNRDAGFATAARNGRWDALQARWTPPQRDAWGAVRKAADDYFESVSSNETDMSGSARGVFAVEARETLETALFDAVTRFDGGARPTQKAADFARADKALNATYKATMAKLAAGRGEGMFGEYGTINPDGVRETQRAWLRYRDAWVRFATLRWPGTPADAWKAWLTIERTKALAELVHEG